MHQTHARADPDEVIEDSGTSSSTGSRRRLTRDLSGFDLAEAFLLAAVIAVLAIRAFLALTGYPQVGGDTLHVAHMLWGGLGMLVALLVLLLFLGSRVRTAAAWIGGLGFGAFIDELGKFITQDNDYFYRPAVALIYAVFGGVFLIVRWVIRRRAPSRAERLGYAYGALTDLATGRLDERRRKRALELLDDDGPLAAEVRTLLEQTEPLTRPPSRWARLTRRFSALVERLRALAVHPRTRRAVIGLFFLLALGIVVAIVLAFVRRGDPTPPLNALTVGSVVTVAVIGICSLLGAVRLLRGARAAALRLFYAASLVSLVVGQFVAFVAVQLPALAALAVNLVVLVALRAELAAETGQE